MLFLKSLPSQSALYVTLLHFIDTKPSKDLLDGSHYGPIAFLNSDLKIFSKITAICLSLWLPCLVYRDQVGFVLYRQGGDSTGKAIDLIEVDRARLLFYGAVMQKRPSTVLIGLSFSKCCNHLVFWVHLFTYSYPSAATRPPHALSQPIMIKNGTGQGCPFLPYYWCSV